MLAIRVIYTDHREFQFSRLIHRFQADNSCGGFFTAADNRRNQFRHAGMHHVYQIPAVIDDNVRPCLQYVADMGFIFFRRTIIPCMYLQPVLYQSRCHIILSRKGIGACYIHLGTARFQYFAQISGFCLQMYRKGYFLSFKRFCFGKFFFQSAEQVAIPFYPLDFSFA